MTAALPVCPDHQYKKQVELLADIRRRDEEIAKYTKMLGEQMDRCPVVLCCRFAFPDRFTSRRVHLD